MRWCINLRGLLRCSFSGLGNAKASIWERATIWFPTHFAFKHHTFSEKYVVTHSLERAPPRGTDAESVRKNTTFFNNSLST